LSELLVGPKAGMNYGQRLAISWSATGPFLPHGFHALIRQPFPLQPHHTLNGSRQCLPHRPHSQQRQDIMASSRGSNGCINSAFLGPRSERVPWNGSKQPASSKMGSHPGNLPGTRTTAVGAPVAAHLRQNGPHGCARHPIQGCLPHLEAADEPEHPLEQPSH
jgi:hypothetical protein